MAWQYGFNLANNAPGFFWIEKQANFSAFEVQFSVALCRYDRTGRAFTPSGETVADYLLHRDVDVALYVMPFFVHDASHIGKPPGDKSGPGRDPYWLPLAIAQAADQYDWWMRDRDGNRPSGFHRHGVPYYPIDIVNPAWRDWFVETVTANRPDGVQVLRFDCAWDGASYPPYIKTPFCQDDDSRSCIPYTAEQVTEAQYALFDALRREGWRIIANAAWYMTNPDASPDKWRFPAMPHLDGVMVEESEAIYVNGKWVHVTDARRRAMARVWLNEGKQYIHVAKWPKDDFVLGFSGYDEFRRFHVMEARTYGYRVAVTHHMTRSQTMWEEDYQIEKPAPLFPHGDSIDDILTRLALKSQCISLNPTAALYRAMRWDGFLPVGPEQEITINGSEYVYQIANNEDIPPKTRIYFARKSEWDRIERIEL